MAKCSQCGFLSLRNLESGAFDEVPDYTRESGEVPKVRRITTKSSSVPMSGFMGASNPVLIHSLNPTCFRRVFDLACECEEVSLDDLIGRFAQVIHKDRACDSFVEWKQGFSPREHEDMQVSEQLRKWQEEERAKERQWQESQEEHRRQWEAGQRQADFEREQIHKKSERRFAIVLMIGAGIFGLVAAAVGAILTYHLAR